MFEINFIIMCLGLRLLCASKTLYQLITFILQKLNSIFNNKYIKVFSLVSIKLKFCLIIEHDLKRRKFNERMNDVIIYIL